MCVMAVTQSADGTQSRAHLRLGANSVVVHGSTYHTVNRVKCCRGCVRYIRGLLSNHHVHIYGVIQGIFTGPGYQGYGPYWVQKA